MCGFGQVTQRPVVSRGGDKHVSSAQSPGRGSRDLSGPLHRPRTQPRAGALSAREQPSAPAGRRECGPAAGRGCVRAPHRGRNGVLKPSAVSTSGAPGAPASGAQRPAVGLAALLSRCGQGCPLGRLQGNIHARRCRGLPSPRPLLTASRLHLSLTLLAPSEKDTVTTRGPTRQSRTTSPPQGA